MSKYESYFQAYLVFEVFDDIFDITVSRSSMKVEVRPEMEDEVEFIGFLEDRGWTYVGKHREGTGHMRRAVYTFEL